MYIQIKEYLEGLLTTYNLSNYKHTIHVEDADINTDVGEYYGTERNRPGLVISYPYVISFSTAINQGKNKEDTLVDLVETMVEGTEIGQKTARGNSTTINSRECYIRAQGVRNLFEDDIWITQLRINITTIKDY